MMIVCQHGAQRIIMFPMESVKDGEIRWNDVTVLVDSYEGKSLNSPNDVTIFKNKLYFTDPPYGLTGGETPDGKERDSDLKFDIMPQSAGVYEYDMMSGKVLKIVEYEKGYTPNGVVVTTLSTGVTRMFVGQTEPYAAILVYDNNGNGFET
eukprot:UN24528